MDIKAYIVKNKKIMIIGILCLFLIYIIAKYSVNKKLKTDVKRYNALIYSKYELKNTLDVCGWLLNKTDIEIAKCNELKIKNEKINKELEFNFKLLLFYSKYILK